MAMSNSPDAAGVMKELFTSQQSSGGLIGLIKKLVTIQPPSQTPIIHSKLHES
jgi:hypothetical protein